MTPFSQGVPTKCDDTIEGGTCVHRCSPGYEGGSVTCNDGSWIIEACTQLPAEGGGGSRCVDPSGLTLSWGGDIETCLAPVTGSTWTDARCDDSLTAIEAQEKDCVASTWIEDTHGSCHSGGRAGFGGPTTGPPLVDGTTGDAYQEQSYNDEGTCLAYTGRYLSGYGGRRYNNTWKPPFSPGATHRSPACVGTTDGVDAVDAVGDPCVLNIGEPACTASGGDCGFTAPSGACTTEVDESCESHLAGTTTVGDTTNCTLVRSGTLVLGTCQRRRGAPAEVSCTYVSAETQCNMIASVEKCEPPQGDMDMDCSTGYTRGHAETCPTLKGCRLTPAVPRGTWYARHPNRVRVRVTGHDHVVHGRWTTSLSKEADPIPARDGSADVQATCTPTPTNPHSKTCLSNTWSAVIGYDGQVEVLPDTVCSGWGPTQPDVECTSQNGVPIDAKTGSMCSVYEPDVPSLTCDPYNCETAGDGTPGKCIYTPFIQASAATPAEPSGYCVLTNRDGHQISDESACDASSDLWIPGACSDGVGVAGREACEGPQNSWIP